MHVATVYLVTNMTNGHEYVGVTRFTPEYRWSQHVWQATNRRRTYLHRAIAKYGAESFKIEAVASCVSLPHIGDVERAVIRSLAPVYNQTNGGEITRGRRVSRDVIQRIVAKNTGLRRTAAQNLANSEQAKARLAKPAFRSAAAAVLSRVRANIDETKRRAAVSLAARSRVWTDEARAKVSALHKGRVNSPDALERARAKKIKPITCPELDMAFGCVDEAAIRLGLSVSSIYKVCSGAQRSVDGLTFSYGAQ